MSALRAFFSQWGQGEGDKHQPGKGRRSGTERRKAERRSNVFPFEDKENRLRFAARAAGFGIYDLDCQTGNSVWSPELKAMAGLPVDDALVPMPRLEELLHPADRERFMGKLQASLRPECEGLEDEFRLLRPDGTVRWVRARGRTFFFGTGGERRALVATGIIIDITSSRAAEQALLESRAELGGLIESVLDAIISIDAEQRIVLFNPAACRMFRCSMAEALGSPLDRFIPAASRRAHREHVRRFVEEGASARSMGQPGVFSGLRADGEEFPIEASISKIQVSGQWRLTVVVRDITERKEAEEALRRSRQDLELAVHGAAMGIWSWDMRSGEMLWSERFYRLFGIPRHEPASQERFLAALAPEDRDRTREAVRRTVEEREEFNLEYRIVWPDGSVHWLALVGRCFYNEERGEPERMSGVVLDITARKNGEEALRRLNEQLETRIEDRTAELIRSNEALERSNLDLQQFAYIAAHDLQTPLRSISGFAQLLHKDYLGKLDAKADTWLNQLMRAAQQMHALIQDLLIYSRVDSRGSAFRPVDFRQLFDDVVNTLDASVRESGARVSRGDLPIVMGDPTQLAQVLQNLIDNGIKYRGEAPSKVHVSARKLGDEWIFTVRDNGIGIAGKHRERIFDIFHRLHTQQEYPGTGIGLAVCRRVVHRHGGRIWVDSEPGKGSAFHFTLPDRESANS